MSADSLASEAVAASASLSAVATAARKLSPVRGGTHVSRQSPNSRRRKGTAEGPCRVQARDRREIRSAILHHQFGRENCTSLSLRGVGADRAEAGRAFHLQSYEEEIPGSCELLGTAGGNGRPRPAVDTARAARLRTEQGRS